MHVHYVHKSTGVVHNNLKKSIGFFGLLQLANITKEDCYIALDVVMRHYNKAVFSVKLI